MVGHLQGKRMLTRGQGHWERLSGTQQLLCGLAVVLEPVEGRDVVVGTGLRVGIGRPGSVQYDGSPWVRGALHPSVRTRRRHRKMIGWTPLVDQVGDVVGACVLNCQVSFAILVKIAGYDGKCVRPCAEPNL